MAPTPRELRDLYGLPANMTPRSVLNTLMRQRWPGGAEILDVIERLHQMQHGRPRPDDALQYLLDNLRIARDKIAEAMTADGLAKLIGCDASTVRERRRYLHGEGGKYRPGAPLAEDRVDWRATDWAKSDAELGRLYGISRQAVRDARLRHAPK